MQNFEMRNNTDIKYAREIRKKRSEIKESLKTKFNPTNSKSNK